MIIARWQIDARFGHKKDVMDSIRRWNENIGSKIGFSQKNMRMMTGSIGVNESTVVMELELDSISALDEAWEKMGNLKEHKQWSKELEPKIVSGSHRWEVYRKM